MTAKALPGAMDSGHRLIGQDAIVHLIIFVLDGEKPKGKNFMAMGDLALTGLPVRSATILNLLSSSQMFTIQFLVTFLTNSYDCVYMYHELVPPPTSLNVRKKIDGSPSLRKMKGRDAGDRLAHLSNLTRSNY